MEFQDDRTQAQKSTHSILVGGIDSFMSGWGLAAGGVSFAFWACRPDDAYRVERWVRNRGDIKRVREVGRDYRPQGVGHCHVYVIEPGHPALD